MPTETPRGNHGNEDTLPAGNPAGDFSQAPIRHSAIELGIDTADKMIKFTMTHMSGENLTGSTDEDGHFLVIPSGAYIALTITLSTTWKWAFDNEPLSFKKHGDAHYYRLKDSSARSITIWARSTDPAPVPPTAGHTQSHGFNLYVLMDQSSKKAFPVRLDPDLKNPPPPQYQQPAAGPVPIA
ncbi:MAG: hypothetical protein ACKOOL_10260 [Novosphingobium sp.]